MKKKFSALLIAITLCCVFWLAACASNVSATEHIHNYSAEWTATDPEYHWHECLNEGCTEKEKDKGSHRDVGGDGKCDVCGRDMFTETVAATSITLNTSMLILDIGDEETLTASLLPENTTDRIISWTVESTGAVTVDGSGKVTAVAAGTAKITVMASNNLKAVCTVTVGSEIEETVYVTGITLDKTEMTLEVGDEEALIASVLPDNATDKTVSWTVEPAGIVTVSNTGNARAVSSGNATITATTSNGITATCTVTVNTPIILPTGITLDKTEMTLEVGDEETLIASVLPDNATDRTVVWTVEPAGVVTVSNTGNVRAVSAGNATITATTSNGITATCTVTVNTPIILPTGITLDKTEMTLEVGDEETLIASVLPDNATDRTVVWTVEPAGVVTVNNTGNVRAVSAGNATITATTSNGITATCAVTVNTPTEPLIYREYAVYNDNVLSYGVSGVKDKTLTSAVIPSTYKNKPVVGIDESAFSGCSDLIEISIPDSVIQIGRYAFLNCKSLSEITIPSSVTSLGLGIITGCDSLSVINVDGGNTAYHSAGNCLIDKERKTLVAGCKNSVIPTDGSVTSVGAYAFFYCRNLTEINIPNGIISIGEYAFSYCRSLTEINIPDSVTSIGEVAFYECRSLTEITIPGSVTDIGERAFCWCNGLLKVTIQNGITEIKDSTFASCQRLTSISIPNSVTSIGERAFGRCLALTEIELPDSVTSMGRAVFNGCSNLTEITVPSGITSIESYSFYRCSSLKKVTLPNSVTSIGNAAFRDCISLTEITIPDSMTSIDFGVFYGCSSLTEITIPKGLTSILSGVFRNCSGLTSISVESGNAKYYSVDNCIIETESKTLILGCKNSVIPSDGSVTSIGNRAFYGCTGLTEIEIPSSVTSIEYEAFYGCTGLTEITIPDSMTSIDFEAFYGCSGLTEITIPKSVTSIGWGVFEYCDGLISINVESGNAKYYSVDNCIIETESKTLILGCKNSVIPSDGSVTRIESRAFSGCSSLTEITIPVSVTIIGYSAFYDCRNLTSIIFSGTKAQWNAIEKITDWDADTGNYTIHCTDGDIAKS